MSRTGDLLPFWIRRTIAPAVRATSPHFSTCFRCGLPWCFVTERPVAYISPPPDQPFGMTMSGFALCRKCWEDLASAEMRAPYYVALADLWASPHNGIHRDELRQRFRDSVLKESMA